MPFKKTGDAPKTGDPTPVKKNPEDEDPKRGSGDKDSKNSGK
jgi:hypothetical protein